MARTGRWLAGVGLVACVLAAVLGAAWAQGKPENTVVVYSAADSDMVNAVAAAFEKKNPGIKVSTVVAGTGEIIKRMEAEQARPLGDVGWSFGPEAIGGMADLIAFFNARWPQVAGDPPATSGAGDTVITVVIVVVGVVVAVALAAGLRRRNLPDHGPD